MMEHFYSFFNLAKISTPLIVYLTLIILLRVALSRIQGLKHGYLKQALTIIKVILHTLIIVITVVTTLGVLGIDVQGIVAGLGLMSFAIGLILKDAVSSSISGLSILLYKPFKIGDEIRIDDLKGRVLKMDVRYTTLESGKELYLIPNSHVIDSKIIITKEDV
jgi:small conductance mechanosensitive channel